MELHVGDGALVHLVDDTLVVRSKDLSTVLPVSLVTIVLAGVMAGGDVHAALSLEVTDGEGALRCRTKVVEEISLDAISREDVSHGLSIEATVVTAVMAHNDRDFLAILKVLL